MYSIFTQLVKGKISMMVYFINHYPSLQSIDDDSPDFGACGTSHFSQKWTLQKQTKCEYENNVLSKKGGNGRVSVTNNFYLI